LFRVSFRMFVNGVYVGERSEGIVVEYPRKRKASSK
jgi:hypothetical protein